MADGGVRSGFDGRHFDGEGRALAQFGADDQAAAMAVENMLDDGKAEAGAAAGAALLDIDAVKAFGEARKVLLGDAWTVIANSELMEALDALAFNLDEPARACIFDRILDKVLHHLDELVPVALYRHGRIHADHNLDARLLGEARQGVTDMACHLRQIDGARGT